MSVEMSGKMSVENTFINKTSQQILSILKDDSTVTITQLAAQLQLSTRTIERNIKLLQQKQLLQRVGSNKVGYWKVTE